MTTQPMQAPAGTTLLIRGGQVMLPDGDWDTPAIADIAIAGEMIIGIAPRFEKPAGAGIEELDARGHLVLPGFVNSHYHSHDVLAKGSFEEIPLETWCLNALPPQFPPRSVEEIHARTLLGALECLRSGMTTVQDMLTLYPFDRKHFDAVMDAYDRIGIRTVFALQFADLKSIDSIPYWKETFPQDMHSLLTSSTEPERHIDLLAQIEDTCLRATPRPRMHWALGPSAPQRCSIAIMKRTMELARKYDLPIYSHVYESRSEAVHARQVLGRHGGSQIREMAAEGLLGPNVSLAHSVWMSRDEIALLAETGTGVVINPQGNLKMKCGIAPIRLFQDAGVRTALGCDNCSCSDAQNMFVAMKLYALLATISDPHPGPSQPRAALYAATQAGAEGARLGDRIGRIAEGYRADLTLIDMKDPSWVPCNSAVRQLVHIEAGRGVNHVVVNGQIVLRNRRLATIDEDEIYEAIEAVMPNFRKDLAAASARVERLQPWLDKAHRLATDAELDIDRYYIPF
jgi:5-methylthioadenosine/S-adenosylhomocysteine deaminase